MLSAVRINRSQTPPPFGSILQDRSDRFRIAFEDAAPGLIVSRDDGTIRLVNAGAAAIFGFSPLELAGKPLAHVLPAAQEGEHAEFWKNPHTAATLKSRTVAGIRRDGVEVPLELRLRSLEDGTGRHVIVSVVDVSERIDHEASLAAAASTHVEFHNLVAKLAARFCAIEPDDADDATADALRQVGEALQLDWTGLWQWRSSEAVPAWQQLSAQPAETPGDTFPLACIPAILARLEAGESCCFTSLSELTDSDREAFHGAGLRSAIILPLTPTGDGDGMFYALALGSATQEQDWSDTVIDRLRLIVSVVSQAFARRDSYRALQKAQEEVRQMRDRAAENLELRREVKVVRTSGPIVAESAQIQAVLAQIQQVAPTPATVLLLGETGTGKEVMAQAIHDLSPRRQRPMIRVSCAAIPTALIESELFGRERGAYTGALSRQIGRFEAANQSTLFLDEIGDLPMEVQVKLLRVLQERVIERLGSTQSIKVDVRIIAATNHNLEDGVRDKVFREDLFYRLNVFPVVVPPLRERPDDIPALVWKFIDEFSRSFGKTIDSISKASLTELQRYPWPGNVRELRNVIERAVIVATGRQLIVGAPRVGERPVPHTAMTLNELEVEHIRAVLRSTSWRVRGSGGAAERLGLKPTTLESRMARLGIAREK